MKYIATTVMALAVCSGCMSTGQRMPWEDPHYSKDVPATQADSRAKERAEGGWTLFIRHHENRKKWVSEQDVDLLMVGDSILFEYSRSAQPVWDKYYGNRKAVNIASSGDATQHMLWHFQDGGLDGMKNRNPKVVVLLLGTNNREDPDNGGKDSAAGVLAILKEIHQRLPESKIVLMALLPRGWTAEDKGRIRNNQVNQIIHTYADNKTVYWLDVGHVFLDKEGNLSRELIKDGLHPSTPKGYQALSEAMEPMIKELLGE
jgi:beta-glucosidase